jgi:hypothetical protein
MKDMKSSHQIFEKLVEVDSELHTEWKRYLASEYPQCEALENRIEFMDMGFIARSLVQKAKAGKTSFFATFFQVVEEHLDGSDDYQYHLLALGLLETIQNICLHEGLNYNELFRSSLSPQTTVVWDDLTRAWGV